LTDILTESGQNYDISAVGFWPIFCSKFGQKIFLTAVSVKISVELVFWPSVSRSKYSVTICDRPVEMKFRPLFFRPNSFGQKGLIRSKSSVFSVKILVKISFLFCGVILILWIYLDKKKFLIYWMLYFNIFLYPNRNLKYLMLEARIQEWHACSRQRHTKYACD